MSVNGRFKDFSTADLLAEADRFGIGEAKTVIKQVHQAVKAWPEFAREADVSEKEIKHIGDLHCLL